MTPDQAAAAARTAPDLINGMLGSGGKSGLAPVQIDPDQAAATAESAARVLNGMFGGRGLGASGSDEGAAPMALDRRSDRKHRN
jgi:hypothetical protein